MAATIDGKREKRLRSYLYQLAQLHASVLDHSLVGFGYRTDKGVARLAGGHARTSSYDQLARGFCSAGAGLFRSRGHVRLPLAHPAASSFPFLEPEEERMVRVPEKGRARAGTPGQVLRWHTRVTWPGGATPCHAPVASSTTGRGRISPLPVPEPTCLSEQGSRVCVR